MLSSFSTAALDFGPAFHLWGQVISKVSKRDLFLLPSMGENCEERYILLEKLVQFESCGVNQAHILL